MSHHQAAYGIMYVAWGNRRSDPEYAKAGEGI